MVWAKRIRPASQAFQGREAMSHPATQNVYWGHSDKNDIIRIRGDHGLKPKTWCSSKGFCKCSRFG